MESKTHCFHDHEMTTWVGVEGEDAMRQMSIWKTILVTAYTWYLLYLPKSTRIMRTQ